MKHTSDSEDYVERLLKSHCSKCSGEYDDRCSVCCQRIVASLWAHFMDGEEIPDDV